MNINDAFSNLFALSLPHGGWKSSGIGARFGGAQGLRKYTRQQVITAPRVPTMKKELLWFPYRPRKGKVIGRMLHANAARDLRRRLGLRPRSRK